MCLYVNKERTLKPPTNVRTYYKVVKCYEGENYIRAPFQNTLIESGWFKASNPWDANNKDTANSSAIHGQAIHVCCTKAEAQRIIKEEGESNVMFILKVRCYPEDFIAFGNMDYGLRTAKQAAYTQIFIQEDDVRAIIKKQINK